MCYNYNIKINFKEVSVMYDSFGEFFIAVKEGSFGFYQLWEWFVNLYYSVTKAPDIMNIWAAFMKFIDPIYPIVPYILIALCLFVVFFGKKLMPVLKFLACFFFGFIGGLYFIGPPLAAIVTVPAWVSGLVVAVVAAVLYRFIYYIAYAVGTVYCVYTLCYSGFYIGGEPEHTLGKALICLGIAVTAAVLAFVFRRHVERIGTAILGGYLISYIIRCFIYDYKAWEAFRAVPWLAAAVITVLIAIPGVIVQYKTRHKYRKKGT